MPTLLLFKGGEAKNCDKKKEGRKGVLVYYSQRQNMVLEETKNAEFSHVVDLAAAGFLS